MKRKTIHIITRRGRIVILTGVLDASITEVRSNFWGEDFNFGMPSAEIGLLRFFTEGGSR